MPYAGEPGDVAPAANRRSVRSGITSSASPPFPSQPLATVDVPIALPAGERRVACLDDVRAPAAAGGAGEPAAARLAVGVHEAARILAMLEGAPAVRDLDVRVTGDHRAHAALLSVNCASSVEPSSASVELSP